MSECTNRHCYSRSHRNTPDLIVVADKTCVTESFFFFVYVKEDKVLQGMIDKLNEIGRCYGMEMNVE